MLPKVATHIFHHTSRVAAAVQNQTTQAIRNAWQQQANPSASTGSGSNVTNWSSVGSSSGWGSSSAGPGGAKYNTGSRFYSGYTGPGRSVAQANSSSAQADDNEEPTVRPVHVKSTRSPIRPRIRSSSLSLPIRSPIDYNESLGVLQLVQTRVRHAFTSASVTSVVNDPSTHANDMKHPALVRRNSTSTHSVTSQRDLDTDIPPPSLSSEALFAPEPNVTDPAAPQSVAEPLIDSDLESYERIRLARDTREYDKVLAEVERYRSQPRVTVPCYNIAMQGLLDTRTVGQPITFILELYNEMLARSLLPNIRTYVTIMTALCTRDAEVQRVIVTLENRVSRRTYTGRVDANASSTDQARIAQLRAENNFGSALTLFQAVSTIKNQSLGLPLYNALLRSCAWHSNVDAAIRVYAHMERFLEVKPSPTTFSALMTVYCNVADLEGAQEVFHEFKEASKRGDVAWHSLSQGQEKAQDTNLSASAGRPFLAKTGQISVWNKMIDTYFKCGQPAAALGLLESMLDTRHGQDFRETDAPLPNSVTYTSIIGGFCEIGDWKSALSWFDRLLAQPRAAQNPFEPLSHPPRPDQLAWIAMIDTLARNKVVDELNRLFTKLQEIALEDGLHLRTIDRYTVFRANVDAIKEAGIGSSHADTLLEYILKEIMVFDNPAGSMAFTTAAARNMLIELTQVLVEHNRVDSALDVVERFVSTEREVLTQAEVDGTVVGDQVLYHIKGVRGMVQTISGTLLGWSRAAMGPPSLVLPVKLAMRVATLCESVGMQPQHSVASWYIQSYMHTKSYGEDVNLSILEWQLLARAFVASELPPMDPSSAESSSDRILSPRDYVFPGLKSLLTDMVAKNIDISEFDRTLQRKITKALLHAHGQDETLRFFQELGGSYADLLHLPGNGLVPNQSSLQEGGSIPLQQPCSGVHIDLYHSRFIEEWFPVNPAVSPLLAFERFQSGAQRGIYPTPECLGRLIGGLGRLGEVEKVRTLYDAAQHVLAALEDQKRWQSAGWFIVEDQMIIAFAHAGQFDAAHVHRMRILEQGGTPSADAYGALISSVKDTTDDTSNAVQLWEEAMTRNVRPNIYMYNTIISKLAKARKADHALTIFQMMRTEGVKPSSVTYGALIAACSRVGDAQSAEHLFHEMTSAPNFKPRVPPYNTMIQMYTYTKPDRERVLYYYNAMLVAKVRPTAHTYKLLLDAYGTIQPVDTASMEDIFARVAQSRDVEVQGTHWAAIINAYGCAGKDLNRAIGVFESISDHPSTSRAKISLPDAVVYEALFNVFSVHRRPDLIQAYIQRLRASYLHPTAYVVNAAIKGYAAAGDLEGARAMFESMEDPPMGVAAPHNHISHDSQRTIAEVPAEAPVYREPSTWETMVRAELGVSERQRAVDLIARMESRQYPPAVVQRVKDIMHSDSLGGSLSPDPSPVSST